MQSNNKTRRFFMTGMLLLLLPLSSTALLLGCEDDGIETISETANEFEETHEETVEELNLLLQDETELQTHFEETLETDDELTSLGDGSSAVFTNLSTRMERIERLGELEEEYAAYADTLSDYTGDKLDISPLESLAGDVDQFTERLATFRGEYAENIEEQERYFEELAAEDATYEMFTDGINELNEQHEMTREHFYVLDEELSNLAEGLEDLQQTIQSAQEGEE